VTVGRVSVGFMPTVRYRRIAIELRVLREAAGFSVEQVAEMLNCDPADMVAIEECRRPIPPETLGYLLRYGYRVADEDYLEYLSGLAANGHRRDWTQMLVDGTPSYRRMDEALMRGAVGTWLYSPTAIPPILQVPEYRRELGGAPEEDPVTSPTHSVEVWVILGEAALYRRVGSAVTWAAQHGRLATLAESAHVDLRVLPLSAPVGARYPQEFSMVDFLTPEGDNGVVCLRSPSRVQFIDRSGEIGRYHAAFHQLAGEALDPDESLAKLRALA